MESRASDFLRSGVGGNIQKKVTDLKSKLTTAKFEAQTEKEIANNEWALATTFKADKETAERELSTSRGRVIELEGLPIAKRQA
ncbi:hypothetical protein TIFTF001_039769 [Ficus carica]|uniref:Uncharacterized protein n=1 Tax=Ficus carica TaxID=3494 RepID=A0AA87YQJ2_FICCA|nr:hypothetical protein TIFTF001_049824 [Ficus carica]GMN19277.1 hypothetical protein TIFTF001_039769 [Ficus carica]